MVALAESWRDASISLECANGEGGWSETKQGKWERRAKQRGEGATDNSSSAGVNNSSASEMRARRERMRACCREVAGRVAGAASHCQPGCGLRQPKAATSGTKQRGRGCGRHPPASGASLTLLRHTHWAMTPPSHTPTVLNLTLPPTANTRAPGPYYDALLHVGVTASRHHEDVELAPWL